MRRVQPTIADDGQRPCPGESHLTASGLSPGASTELGLIGQQDDGAGLGHLKGQLAVDDNSLDGDPVTVCVPIQNNSGIAETITVRRIAYGVGVERVFPVHSPNVDKIEVLSLGKIRRSKLYYLRDRVGKAAKLKQKLK